MDDKDLDDTTTKLDAQAALASLPSEGVVWACAYGSRYMEASKTSQLDLLLAIDPELLDEWHFANIERNPNHYFPARFPSVAYGLATRLQRSPPGALFHTFVEHPDYHEKIANGLSQEQIGSQYWKYGVISTDSLLEDLNTWEHLYIGGRLHKPVLDLDPVYFSHHVERLREAKRANLKAAAASALILLPQNFSELDLYYVISSLSYAGDIRLVFGGENPKKLENMVYNSPNSLKRFQKLYDQVLDEFESRQLLLRSRKPSTASSPIGLPVYKFEQNPTMKPELLRSYLPEKVQDFVWQHAKHSDEIDHHLKEYVFKTVRRSSTRQLVNNIFMNDPLKSAKYAFAKLAKGIFRKR